MSYQTIRVGGGPKLASIVLDRPEDGNPVNLRLVEELEDALGRAEADPGVRVVTIEGREGVFSTGMDFRTAATSPAVTAGEIEQCVARYFGLLKRFTRSGKVIAAKVDGRVNAGGVGLVAACDFVIATERTSFSLSEALFGLLPANVVPFLMRRIGFQRAYVMTLTAQPLEARAALAAGLIDELSQTPDDGARRLLVRVDRVRERTIRAAKGYFEAMWFVHEGMEREAMRRSVELLGDPETYEAIRAFVEEQVFPWQRR
jgi:polyketide biosynthesis enoyl-CoA hydratase PksH